MKLKFRGNKINVNIVTTQQQSRISTQSIDDGHRSLIITTYCMSLVKGKDTQHKYT